MENAIHDRLELFIRERSLKFPAQLDAEDPSGGLYHTTRQAVAELRRMLRPWIDAVGAVPHTPSLEELGAMYLERFGDKSR